ncbi:histidine kinase [Candidatus Gastranaerophilus sp. (ex Termes propinquus)]|nr:histidine kinase [Candidatus Gastranaerophilus sp. (ex Termes propinquus)]
MQRTKTSLKDFIKLSESPVFGKKTIQGLLRSILEPIAQGSTKAFVLTRLIDKTGIEGLLRRIEYSRDVEMHEFVDVAKKNNLIELEFVLITSQRYSALLIWDYSEVEEKNASQLYFLLNSVQINEAFEILQKNMKEDFSKSFYEFKPERRDNLAMNQAVFNILTLLNENVLENDFIEGQAANLFTQDEFNAHFESSRKYIKEISHEIKNQLSIMDIYSKILERNLGADNKSLEVFRKSLNIVSSQLEELREFQNVQLAEKSLFETVSKAVEMLAPLLGERGNEIVFKSTKACIRANIDENKYISTLINIIKNASESTRDDKIEVELSKAGAFAKVFVTNYGEKIEEPGRIFASGFSTKNTLGVGLSVSKRYLQMQGSTLELEHSDESSTCFVITTPLVEEVSYGFD